MRVPWMLQRPVDRPRTLGFCYFLRQFIQMRWAACAGAAATIATSQHVLEISFEYSWLYGIVVAMLAYNATFYFLLEHSVQSGFIADFGEQKQVPVTRLLALGQILLDLISLFWLLHFAGGLVNPFVLFFLLHVVVAGTLLEARPALLVALLASALVFALGLSERLGLLEHYHPSEILGETDPTASWLFVVGLPAVMTVTILALSFLTIVIMNERGRRRDQILALSEELDRKNRKLMRVDQMRQRLLAVASHDLKSPIAAVSSYLMGMRDGYLGDLSKEQRRVLDRSLNRLSRLRDFVTDVLDWTSIERGALRQNMHMVELGDILRAVVDDHLEAASEKNIDLEVEIEEDLPKVVCSAERITQAFDNLVSNAVKYTLDGGSVEVEAQQVDDRVLVSVADTGIGISQKDLENLFQDFFRSSSVKGKFEGTGLGLSVVRRIVGAHNGRVWARSELNKGTTFYVELPIRQTRR